MCITVSILVISTVAVDLGWLLACAVAGQVSPEDLGHIFFWTETQTGPSSTSY